MPYTHTSLADAEAELALRLADSALVRYLADELDLYIYDALRTWNAITGMAQTTALATLPAGSTFIDLPTLFPAQRAYNVTDQDLIGIIQYHFLEPKNVSGWSGTEMFTLADFTQALQRRRDQFLLETGCRITRHAPIPGSPATLPPDVGDVALDQNIIDIRRAAWTTYDGRTTPLWTSSNWALRGSSSTWNISPSDPPRVYAYNQRAPNSIQIAPPNLNPGTLDLLTVDAGAALDPTIGVKLGVPDDFAPFIKWGAMADLLSKDGPARDYARSLFCERRYQVGVAAAREYAVILDARINDRIVQFSSVSKLDMGIRYWQNLPGAARILAPAGLNLVAVAAPPTALCSLQITMVQNAPIPSQASKSTEFLQVGKEYLDTILGYATQLAMFKVGGQELAATTLFADAFFTAAKDYVSRSEAAQVYERDQFKISGAQEDVKPRGIERKTGSSVGNE